MVCYPTAQNWNHVNYAVKIILDDTFYIKTDRVVSDFFLINNHPLSQLVSTFVIVCSVSFRYHW